MFATSTQRRGWLMKTEEQLQDVKQAAYEANLKKLKEIYRIKHVADETYLSLQSEEKLVFSTCQEIVRLFEANFPSHPRRVSAAACSFFRRYYLTNSVMDYHPWFIMLMAVFLACKSEEYFVPLPKLCKAFDTKPQGDATESASAVKQYEVKFCKELKFHLFVHSPFRPLRGFLAHLRAFTADHDGGLAREDGRARDHSKINWERLASAAEKSLSDWWASDVQFLFPPSQIALACLAHTIRSEDAFDVDVDAYLTSLTDQAAANTKGSSKSESVDLEDSCNIPCLQAQLSAIATIARQNMCDQTLSSEQRKTLLADLEACRNPFLDPKSEEFKLKIREKAKRKADKSAQAAKAVKRG